MTADFPINSIAGVIKPYNAPRTDSRPESTSVQDTKAVEGAKKFESMVMAQLTTQMLPSESIYFGEGFSGNVWKSMLAEHIAEVMVDSTDFGIASLISNHPKFSSNVGNENKPATSLEGGNPDGMNTAEIMRILSD